MKFFTNSNGIFCLAIITIFANDFCFAQSAEDITYSKKKTLERIKNHIDSDQLMSEASYVGNAFCKAFEPNCSCTKAELHDSGEFTYRINNFFSGEWGKSNIIVYGSLFFTKKPKKNLRIHLLTTPKLNQSDQEIFDASTVFDIFGKPMSKRDGYSIHLSPHGKIKTYAPDYKNNIDIWITYTYKTQKSDVKWDFLTIEKSGVSEIVINVEEN